MTAQHDPAGELAAYLDWRLAGAPAAAAAGRVDEATARVVDDLRALAVHMPVRAGFVDALEALLVEQAQGAAAVGASPAIDGAGATLRPGGGWWRRLGRDSARPAPGPRPVLGQAALAALGVALLLALLLGLSGLLAGRRPAPSVGGGPTAVPGVAQTPGSACWESMPLPAGLETVQLQGLASLPDGRVWAVGSRMDAQSGRAEAEALEYTGGTWQAAQIPRAAGGTSVLYAVLALTPDDVWAVGASGSHVLILHWDGRTWTNVPGPNPGAGGNGLAGIAAVSATDIWAVGSTTPARSSPQPLLIHWDGRQWTERPAAILEGAEGAESVAAVAANDVWVVGQRAPNTALVLHWAGMRWAALPPPPGWNNVALHSALAFTPAEIWVGGEEHELKAWLTATLHWDGRAWTRVPSPNQGGGSPVQPLGALSALSGTGPADVWAAGQWGESLSGHEYTQPLVLHWDGRQWGVDLEAAAVPAAPMTLLEAGAVPPSRMTLTALTAQAGTVWAAGSYTMAATTAGGSTQQALLIRRVAGRCTSPPGVGGTPASTAPNRPTPAPTGSPRLPGPVGTMPAQVRMRITDAWGAQVAAQIQHVSPALPGGYSLLVQSLSEDGRWLLATANPPPTADGSFADQPVKVVAIDLAGGQVDTIFTPADARTIPYGVQADATWIVWEQDRSSADWELYAYNRATHARTPVATGAAGGSSPQMDHGLIVWAESVPGAGSAAGAVVKLADVATGQVRTLASDATRPQISWPYVAWLIVPDATVQPPTAAAIVVLNLQSGTKTQLATPVRPVEFALSQDTIAWIGAAGDRITLTNVAETFTQILPLGGFPGAFRDVTLNDRLVTWSPLDDLQVWDRRLNQVVTIAPQGGSHNFVTSGHLVWTAPVPAGPPPAYAIHILDTTRLP